jgi:NhaP-type Na+/H+ or K+/H+ antiporter
LDQLNLVIAAVGALVLFLGLVSDYFRRNWWASDPLISLLIGILLSPSVTSLLTPDKWGISLADLLEQTARLTLAIGLMGVALRLPRGYFTYQWRSQTALLGLVMPLMWFTSGLIIYGVLDLPFWEALLIGAVLTPTDPIVATSIVTGSVAEANLPQRLRCMISAESGANDGLAYPFVVLCLLMMTRSPGAALSHWLFTVILWEVLGAILVGAVLGYLAGFLLEWAERNRTIEQSSFLGYSLALSLTILGVAKLMGTDGILSVFVAGLAFDYMVDSSERVQEENVQEAINRFFTLPIFLLLGLLIPWQQWWAMGWKSLVLVLAILLLRRLPAVLLCRQLIHPITRSPWPWLTATYVGWFGPIGVAAIYYAGYSMNQTEIDPVWPVCSLMICASILAQGMTSSPLTRLYGKLSDRIRHNHP